MEDNQITLQECVNEIEELAETLVFWLKKYNDMVLALEDLGVESESNEQWQNEELFEAINAFHCIAVHGFKTAYPEEVLSNKEVTK